MSTLRLGLSQTTDRDTDRLAVLETLHRSGAGRSDTAVLDQELTEPATGPPPLPSMSSALPQAALIAPAFPDSGPAS